MLTKWQQVLCKVYLFVVCAERCIRTSNPSPRTSIFTDYWGANVLSFTWHLTGRASLLGPEQFVLVKVGRSERIPNSRLFKHLNEHLEGNLRVMGYIWPFAIYHTVIATLALLSGSLPKDHFLHMAGTPEILDKQRSPVPIAYVVQAKHHLTFWRRELLTCSMKIFRRNQRKPFWCTEAFRRVTLFVTCILPWFIGWERNTSYTSTPKRAHYLACNRFTLTVVLNIPQIN